MTLKAQIESDLPVFFNTDEFASSVVYNGNTGTGILTKQQDLAQSETGQSQFATLTIRKSFVADPTIYDTIVVDGITWRVNTVLKSDDYASTLMIEAEIRSNPKQ